MSIESPVRQLDEIIDAGSWLIREAVEAAIEKHGKLDFLPKSENDRWFVIGPGTFGQPIQTLTLENGDVVQAEEVSERDGIYSATFDLAKYEAGKPAEKWPREFLDSLETKPPYQFAADMSMEDCKRAAQARERGDAYVLYTPIRRSRWGFLGRFFG